MVLMLCSCNNQVQFNEHVIIKQKIEAFKFLSKYHHQLHIMIGEEEGDGAESFDQFNKAISRNDNFTSKNNLDVILEKIKSNKNISYQAVNKSGDIISNVIRDNVNVVTWGVFPGEKIKQPTIVDARSFMIWKDEAFSLWINDWASIYEKDSISYSIINNIYENYFLVNIVDNDFISSNMIKQILKK